MYVCVCNAVTESEIRQAMELGAQSLQDLKHSLGVAANCGKCASSARCMLRAQDKQMSCDGGRMELALQSA